MFHLILVASYATFVNSKCSTGGYTCTPTLPPNNDCPGPATNDYVCSSFLPTNACYNEESLCSACCRADNLFNGDLVGIFADVDYLFSSQCLVDRCNTFNPTVQPTADTDHPTVTPSSSPTRVTTSPSATTVNPSVSPTATTDTPSNNPSVTPSNNPSVTPSNNPSVTPSNNPSVTPSNIPSVTPSNIPSVTPSNIPSVTPSISPVASPVTSPVASLFEGNGNEMISIVIPIIFVTIAFIVLF